MKSFRTAAVLGGVSLFALLAGAAQAAEVRGVVVDIGSKAPLPGAQVTSGLQSAITDESGRFILDGLEIGEQTLTASYVGYDDRVQTVTVAAQPTDSTFELVVYDRVSALVITGASQRRALQTKKVADQIEDVLSASDVGKLPDQNVAEAVRRLPGVSVANDQGEGRYVIVRGVNPNLANVTINNLTVPAPEPEGRQVKLDDIPSSLISRVKVIKSLTPDLDANAIAGQVNIDTVSAFDRNRTFANARFARGRYDLNSENPYEVDATVGGVFGPGSQFGAVLSANLSNRPIESENFGASGPSYTLTPPKNGFTTLLPNLVEYRDYNLVRKRRGFVGNFDWRPNDDIKLYLRSNYSKFSDNETRDRYRIDGASFAAINPTSSTTGTFNGRGVAYVRRREEVDTTKGLSVGGDFKLPVGQLSLTAATSKADKVDPLRSEWQFRTANGAVPVSYDLSNILYTFTPTTPATNNYFIPGAYNFVSFNLDRRKATEKLQQLAADYKAPVGFGDDSVVKIGFKYADTRKSNDRAYESYTPKAPAFTLADTSPLTDPVTVYDGRYTLGPRVNYPAAYAYFKANPGRFAYDPTSVTNALINDYDLSEKLTAGYVMADLKFAKWTVVPGVRVEKVEGEYNAKTIKSSSTINDPFNTFGKFGDTDLFPSLNIRYDMSDDVVLRAAATSSIGRPNYADLAPYVSIDTSGSGTVGLGNPNLTASKSTNIDFDAEYYLPGQGILSGGLFYKRISDPIFSATRNPTAAEQTAYGVGAGAMVTQPTNLQKADLWGVELNLETRFTSLPSPLDGLGFSGNITFVNASARGALTSGNPPTARQGEIPLGMQSKQVSTAQLLYEKYGFTGRIAYSRRSQYLLALGATAAADQYVDDYASVDARLAYAFHQQQATVFVEGTNLTNTPYRVFVADPSQTIENERYGASYRIGLQLSY